MNYIIVFDTTQLQYNINDIHRFITTSPKVSDWCHYLSSMYIVTTEMTAKEMSDSFVSNYSGLRHFITRVDLSDYNGVLNNKAWDWLKQKTQTVFRTKPVPQPRPLSIDDLLKRTIAFSDNRPESSISSLLKSIRK